MASESEQLKNTTHSYAGSFLSEMLWQIKNSYYRTINCFHHVVTMS